MIAKLLSGYSPNAPVCMHAERLEVKKRSRIILPSDRPNAAAQESGKQGAESRDADSFQRGIVARELSTTQDVLPEVKAGVIAMMSDLGRTATCRRLGIAKSTFERIVLGGLRIRVDVHARIVTALAMPYDVMSKARGIAPESLVAAVRLVLQEEGSYKSAARRLGVGFTQIVSLLEGRQLSSAVIARMTERVKVKPDEWVSGPLKALQARMAQKERLAAQSRVRMAKLAGGPALSAHDRARVLAELRNYVNAAPSICAAAESLDMNERYLGRILNGGVQPGKTVAARLEGISHPMQEAS